MNPYQPPKPSRPKYKPPLIDWLGLSMFFSVIGFLIVGYLIFVGALLKWVEYLLR